MWNGSTGKGHFVNYQLIVITFFLSIYSIQNCSDDNEFCSMILIADIFYTTVYFLYKEHMNVF